MQKFMESVVNKFKVRQDRVRLGIITFSTTPQSDFTLKESVFKRDVLEAIAKLVPRKGYTYTGEALNYSLQFFNATHGGRKSQKVPQILIVITDGKATNPNILKETSDMLRNNGVTIFSVGVKNSSRDQLETMAGGDKAKVFYVDSFKALENLYKNISSVICHHIKQRKSFFVLLTCTLLLRCVNSWCLVLFHVLNLLNSNLVVRINRSVHQTNKKT